jgi:hypothetical protein
LARRFSRKSKDLLKALRRLGYSLKRGRGDHVKALFITPCADGSEFKFSFPVDRGEIPDGTFRAILNQAGGLTEEQLCQALKGEFTEADYRELIASKTREELLRLTLGRRFRP